MFSCRDTTYPAVYHDFVRKALNITPCVKKIRVIGSYESFEDIDEEQKKIIVQECCSSILSLYRQTTSLSAATDFVALSNFYNISDYIKNDKNVKSIFIKVNEDLLFTANQINLTNGLQYFTRYNANIQKCVQSKNVKNIKQLWCDGNYLSELDLVSLLQKTDQLQTILCRSSNKVSTKVINELSNIKTIEQIHLFRPFNLSESDVRTLANNCKQLKAVTLVYCDNLTDDALISLCEANKNISFLNLTYCRQLTNLGVNTALKVLNNLNSLSLSDCRNLSEECLQNVEVLKKLTHFTSFPNIKNTDVFKKINSLTFLDFAGCKEINDDSLKTVMNENQNLEVLVLGGCEKITDQTVQVLTNYKQLSLLGCWGCPEITIKGVNKLKTSLPGITVVHSAKDDDKGKMFDIVISFFMIKSIILIGRNNSFNFKHFHAYRFLHYRAQNGRRRVFK